MANKGFYGDVSMLNVSTKLLRGVATRFERLIKQGKLSEDWIEIVEDIRRIEGDLFKVGQRAFLLSKGVKS